MTQCIRCSATTGPWFYGLRNAQGLPDGPFCQADWAGYWRERQDELSLAERGTQMLFKWKGR